MLCVVGCEWLAQKRPTTDPHYLTHNLPQPSLLKKCGGDEVM
jgi:hypothetical protein